MLPGRNALQPQRPAAPSAPPRPRPHRRRRSWASAHVAEHLASPAEVEAAGAPPQGVQGLDSTAVGLEGIQAQTVAPAPSPPLPTSPRDTGGAGGAGGGAPGSGGGPGPSLASLADAARVSAARLRRQLEPPPPGFPPGPSGDVAVQLLRDPLPCLERLRQRHGPVAGLLLGGERAVLVSGPAAAAAVLVEGGDIFVKASTAFFPGSSLAGNGLLVSDGEVWRRQRRLANPAFRRAAVERYAEAMLASTTRMLRASWRDGFCRDLYADFNSLTLAITLEALFGARMAAGEDAAGRGITDAIREAFRFFAARGASALALPEWLPTPGNLRFAAAVARLDAAVLGLIAQRRRELAAAPRPPGDLLDSLLLAADEAGQGMGDRAARDEAMTLLVAGQETSAIVLGWACAYLAHHPEAQAAAAAEVAARVGARPLQAADAGRLPWVEAVVLEAMRLSPPAYLVGRCAAEATNLGGYHLPRGTTVLVSPHLLHRDPQHWGPDAAAFRPERWLELQRAQLEQGQPGTQQGVGGSQQPPAGCPHAAAAGNGGSGGGGGVSGGGELGGSGMAFLTGMGPHGAYIPFGAGQRNCIGTGFAMLEAVLVVASILQQYRLEPLPGAPFPAARPQITLRPDSVRLLLRRR